MAKKYAPSGYQIINIDLSAKTSGTAFLPETEDEKLLHEILSSGELKKPILLDITTENYHLSGVATWGGGAITLIDGHVGSSVSERITYASDKLLWTENEE